MARTDTVLTEAQLLDLLPDEEALNRSQGPNDRTLTRVQTLRDLVVSTFSLVATQDSKPSVRAATVAPLAAYARVVDVITANGNGALGAIDGVTLVDDDRLLLNNGASGIDNGIYSVTQIGTAGSPFILTRAEQLEDGASAAAANFVVREGTTLALQRLLCTAASGSDVVNTDALAWVTFQSLDMYGVAPEAVAAAAVIGNSEKASPGNHVHAHGLLADGAALHHDTGQIENMSTVVGADGTAALDQLDTDVGQVTTDLGNHLADLANPHATDIENLGAGTLAELNAAITGVNVDADTASRPPNGAAGGALAGTYPNPTLSVPAAYGGASEATIGAAHNDIVCTVQNTWYPWVEGTAGPLTLVTFNVDAVNGDYLEVTDAGDYRITINVCFSGSPASTYECAAFINAEAQPSTGAHFERALGAGGDVGSAGHQTIHALSAADEIRVKVRCNSGAAKTLTPHHVCLTVERVG